ncbi:MAG TPA: CPBP family intramembrane metalloprotease [Thermoanaerobaculia bacterium]|nr:CPBP family intramembrane metalloprotease [Thermoanaerobaculia bacterium]
MSHLDAALLFGVGLPLLAAILAVADARGRFARDLFPTPLRKAAAMALLFLVLVATVILPASETGLSIDTSRLSFGGVFLMQGLLTAFLALWWLLAGRPPLAEFLALRSERPLAEAGAGVCLGLIGWVLTLAVALVFGGVFRLFDLKGPEAAPPLVQWLAQLSVVKRLVIVACAMTVEEFHFRAFLQRRLGAVPASILFLLAHAGYGEPFFFVGLLAITAVLAAAFRRTNAVWAPMLAHGTFDAVQLFIFLPEALKLLPKG